MGSQPWPRARRRPAEAVPALLLLLCTWAVPCAAAEAGVPFLGKARASEHRGLQGGTASSTTVPPGGVAATGNRTTWNGCACKKTWISEDHLQCNHSCCNPDHDPNGEWCMVENPACEEVAWGYCRQGMDQCVDDPPQWRDSDGDTCDLYWLEEWCTSSGDYGSGWESTWGKFENFTTAGKTARNACCWCGGGTQLAAQSSSSGPARNCTDVRGWEDVDGDGCLAYSRFGWCTSDGGYGPGWHLEEWGKFEEFSDGIPATEACCACGGGNHSGGGARSGETHNAPLVQRTTWNGCACLKDWTDQSMSCHSYCCNIDGDPAGEWCKLVDPKCEDADWGYCRPAGTSEGVCKDTDQSWVDAYGFSCAEYAAKQWCAGSAPYGPGWEDTWGTFPDYSNKGQDALKVCCGCGGGTLGAPPPAPSPPSSGSHAAAGTGTHTNGTATNGSRVTWNGCECQKNWRDANDMKCQSYCCNPDDDPNGDWCLVQDPKCEDETWGYCVTPVGRDGLTCRNQPTGWQDSEGDDCDGYALEEWCTATGDYGEGWDEDWGKFKDYTSDGKDATEACCRCGGGRIVTVDAPVGCVDQPGWRDLDGDTCSNYEDYAWCNATGGFGLGWHEEWGPFPTDDAEKAANAAGACCACGGGSGTAAPKNLTEAAPPSRAHAGEAATMVAASVGVIKLAVLSLAVIAGLVGGWYCYRSRQVEEQPGHLGVKNTPYGKKYQTVEDL